MVNRILLPILRASSKSFLLLGPRQTGKSTLIQTLQPDLSINLARESTFLEFASNPSALEQRLSANTGAKTVFIDEIQRIPSLLNTLQAEIDEKKGVRYFLTGSSARKLRRGQANLNPGRLSMFQLGTLCAEELDFNVDTKRALAYGMLPEAYLSTGEEAKKLLTDYASTYVKEEIQAEALTRNLSGFARFLQVAATSSGQFLDFSKLARRAKVARQSAVRYFEILEDTLLSYRIDPCDNEWIKTTDIVRHPRYFFFDVGVLNGLLQNFTVSADRIGNLFEHLIVNQLVSTAYAKDVKIQISNFRTRSGVEVDFVVSLGGRIFVVEAKACPTDQIQSDEIARVKNAHKHFVKAENIWIVCTDGDRRKIGNILITSWKDLMQEMFNR